jgi:RHS repeat-associated protein
MTAMPSPLDVGVELEATYDAWNRLVKTDDGTTVVEYGYDGMNRRITKASGGTTRHYYYNDQWQVLEERLNASSSADRQYVWGQRYIDDLVLRDTSSERLYALQDALFNVVALTDDDGDVVERFAYQPYGQSEPLDPDYTTYSGTNYSWNYRFTGRELDLETGLQINRMRCLHHQLGRWLTRDPFGYDSGFNLYGYAQGRATGSLDPLGLRETDREWILPWEGGWTWGGTWDLWTNTSPSGHLNGLYTGHTVPPAFINAAAMQGAAQGFNCSADCLACMNKKLAAGTLIIVGGGAVAYGGTPRPIANAIAGREGPMRGRYLKSGVRAAGVRLAHNLPCAGATGAKVGEGIIQHATRVESAFKSGQLARGGVAILAVAEIAIEAYCTKNCLANPNFKCPNGLLTF